MDMIGVAREGKKGFFLGKGRQGEKQGGMQVEQGKGEGRG